MKRHDIERVLEALGIATTRKGGMLWASCPRREHRDSDASWRVIIDESSDRYGQHRCYGCGWGGYAVHLVEEVLEMERDDAREWLEDFEHNARIPFEVEISSSDSRVTRLEVPAGVTTLDDKSLATWPSPVKRYLHRRHVTLDQIARWHIGYAVDGYLAGRIWIPVYDARGELLSYTGRSFTGAELRYKTPKDDEGAALGAILGEEFWSRETIAITEGGFNLLACERVLGESVDYGALYGSQLVPAHLLKLSRFKRVILATDPDKAGNTVAQALRDQLARTAQVDRLEIPEGLDCDDMPPEELARLFRDVGCMETRVSIG